MQIRLPTEQDRLLIIGRTGGGKTQCGLWHLSMQPVDEFPWVIFNWKGDKTISGIPWIKPWSLADDPPVEPGLYEVRPLTKDSEQTEDFLRLCWERENIGLFFDEGQFLKGSAAAADIQIQGRSKNIPTITLTQLPVNLPRPVFTEANFIQVFYVLDKRYRKVISEFTPIESEQIERLKRFWSLYYDVIDNQLSLVKPGPSIESIMARFDAMLRPEEDINGEIAGQDSEDLKAEPPKEYGRFPL